MTVEEKQDVDHENATDMADIGETAEAPSELTLLIVDDDRPFLNRLARAMEARGFAVTAVESVADGLAALESHPPAFAIIDMRLGDGNGIDVISELKAKRPDARGVILTGYANIATAVTAVKLGAFDYLAKPADADEIYHTLMATQADKPDTGESTMSADRVRWEHIQRVFEACDRNVSETARRLNMHRRTLQRILAKRAPR
jgi:two-component system, response regulator RegA